jgi:hypothetical protein
MQGWQRHPWKYLWGVQFRFDNQNPDLIFGDRKLLINLTLQLKESGGVPEVMQRDKPNNKPPSGSKTKNHHCFLTGVKRTSNWYQN